MSDQQEMSEWSKCALQAQELLEQYEASQDIAHLDLAISSAQRAVELTSEDDSAMPKMLSDLSYCLHTRYRCLLKVEDLEGAVSAHQLAVQLTADDDPDMPARLYNLSISLNDRFECLGELEDLGRAISSQRRAVELTPEGHPAMPSRLNNLGIFLGTRFMRVREFEDLESAISAQRRAVELTPEGHPDMPSRLHGLGDRLWNRFCRLGNLDDLESGISTQRRAVELTPEGHPAVPPSLSNLGICLSRRFNRLGELEDIESAISAQRRAIELVPEGDSKIPKWLDNLANHLSNRFERFGDLEDLESVISVRRRVVELAPNGHPAMTSWLDSLAKCLYDRFNRLGELEDLESAISAQRRAVELMPEGHPNMPSRLINLENCLSRRFDHLGKLEDIESIISVKRRVIELTTEGHPEMPVQYDLESAVSIQRCAVELTPEDDRNMPLHLANLGHHLSNRFDRLEDLEDLERAISTQRRAIELTPEGHADMPFWLNSLGIRLRNHFERFGELDDLESALSLLRRAVELTPKGNLDMPGRLGNLSICLNDRFKRFGELDDLESAILAQRHAVELTPEDHPALSRRLNNLGACLSTRFDRLGELEDLESAISTHRRAVELTPEGHPDMPTRLRNLGSYLLRLCPPGSSQESFDAVLNAYRAASLQTVGLPIARLYAAIVWAGLETDFRQFGSPASRLNAFSCIINTLPEVVWLGHTITRRYQESSRFDLIGGAVSAAVDCGDLRQAVEWLDAGRGLIWSQVLSLRTPVDELAQQYPDLAKDFQNVSKELQHAHLLQLPKDTSPTESFFGDNTNKHRQLAITYEGLINQIRALPGFEEFLRPQKLASFASSIEHLDGHIVLLNVSSSRCDALVISRGGAVNMVPLKDLTKDGAIKMRGFYNRYMHPGQVRQRATASMDEGRYDGFLRLLDLLWSWIVHPILEALGLLNPEHERLPHITWCPTGPLTQLPLHAAGAHPESGLSGPHVYDFVVSSYTPSLSMLMRAQESVAQDPSPPNVLIVTQPATPGLSPLPSTVVEGSQLEQMLSSAQIDSMTFSDNNATVEVIGAVIQRFPWVHFACHGVQDTNDPTQSAFALHDGRLTLSTLMKTVAEDAELAFLSACQTATGDEKASEESAHLTAGMLAVGFKGVVGTMWSIGDADAPVVVEAYYKKLLELRRTGAVAKGSTGAAYALHEAVKVLRERVGETSFLRWVPFVHYGV